MSEVSIDNYFLSKLSLLRIEREFNFFINDSKIFMDMAYYFLFYLENYSDERVLCSAPQTSSEKELEKDI